MAHARAERDTLERRYGEKHPQLVDLNNRIEVLEKRAPWVLSFDFPGGSFAKFLTLIAKANVVSFNIITSEPAEMNVELPPFSLRNAKLGPIVRVLGQLLEPRGYELRMVADENQTDGNSVICVLTQRAGASAKTETRPTQFESFPVGQYLSEQSIDDIVGAIRAGGELDPTHDKDALKLKFHQPTAILLVSGPLEATNIAGKIISQLKRPTSKPVKVNANGVPISDADKK